MIKILRDSLKILAMKMGAILTQISWAAFTIGGPTLHSLAGIDLGADSFNKENLDKIEGEVRIYSARDKAN